MKIEDLLKQEKKQSNFEAFVEFIFDQPINYYCRAFSYIPINYKNIEKEIKLFTINSDKFYFILEFNGQPILIYNIDIEKNKVNDCYCLDGRLYKQMMIYLSENILINLIDITNKDKDIP